MDALKELQTVARTIKENEAASARVPRWVKLTLLAPRDAAVIWPIPDKNLESTGWDQILMHPDFWDELCCAAERFVDPDAHGVVRVESDFRVGTLYGLAVYGVDQSPPELS